MCARGGAAVENQLRRKYPNLALVSGENFEDTYDKLNNEECFMLATRASDWDNFQRDSTTNPECKLQWIGRADAINNGGVATKVDISDHCTSLVQAILDIHINEMISDGVMKELWQKYLESGASNQCGNEADKENEDGEKGALKPIDVGK